MVGAKDAPLPPRRPSARAHPAGDPRAGGRSPDEVLQALLAGIPPQDRAGHGGRAEASRVPLPPPPQRRRSRPALRAAAAPSPPSGSSAAGFLLFLLAPPAPHPRLVSSTSTSSSSSPSASWKCHGRISGSAAAGGPRSTKPGAPHSPARGILCWL